MASERVEAGLRVADGLLAIALAVISLVMVWIQVPVAWPGIVISIMAGMLIFLGVLVLIGKTRMGRLVRTHHRWKYILLIGLAIMAVAILIIDRPDDNPTLAFFPVLGGLFVVQVFELEATAKFTMAALGDRDAKIWRRFSLVIAVVGILLACVTAVAAASGNVTLVSFLLPFVILLLVVAAAIWIRLRSRQCQSRGSS